MKPVTFGCVGLGGYGKTVIELLLRHRDAHLTTVYDPYPAAHADRVMRLQCGGVRVHDNFNAFLRDDFEAVWLPVPIGLHRSYSERSLAAGKAVLCEKPAAGCVADVDAMMAARDAARRPLQIAFQDLFNPGVLDLKRHLVAGRMGRLRDVSVLAASPRGDDYYTRAWAGRRTHEGATVMDSPPMNALAHGLALALFLAGPTLDVAAGFSKVEAELFRARPVETFDTAAIRAVLDGDVTFRGYFTHACQEDLGSSLRLRGDVGDLVIAPPSRARFNTASGILELNRDAGNSAHALAGFARSLRGIPLPVDTLAVAKNHVALLEAVSDSPVIDIPSVFLEPTASGPSVRGIEAAFHHCERDGLRLAASPMCPWAHAPVLLETR